MGDKTMPKRIDFTGKRFGYLTARTLTPKVKGVRSRRWICGCAACGGSGEVRSGQLREGLVTSCGCRPPCTVRAFNFVQKLKETGERVVKSHGSDAITPEYFLEPSGKTVLPAIAQSAIDGHELVPLSDGLFADTAQTWVPA